MIDALDIGYIIKDRRAQLGLTQAQLAKAAGVSKRCLWSLELGQNPGVQFNKLTAVLKALNLELNIAEISNTSVNSIEDVNEKYNQKSSSLQEEVSFADTKGRIDALKILTGEE